MSGYQLYVYLAVIVIQVILAESFIVQVSKLVILNRFIKNIISGKEYDTFVNDRLPYNTLFMLFKYSISNRKDKKYIESFTTFVISGFISSIFYLNSILIIGVYVFTLNGYLFLIMLALLQINIVVCITYIVMVVALSISNAVMLKNNKIRILCVDEKDMANN